MGVTLVLTKNFDSWSKSCIIRDNWSIISGYFSVPVNAHLGYEQIRHCFVLEIKVSAMYTFCLPEFH